MVYITHSYDMCAFLQTAFSFFRRRPNSADFQFPSNVYTLAHCYARIPFDIDSRVLYVCIYIFDYRYFHIFRRFTDPYKRGEIICFVRSAGLLNKCKFMLYGSAHCCEISRSLYRHLQGRYVVCADI